MVHLVFVAVVFIAILSRNNNKNIERIAFFVLFIFAAIRYMYGNDYYDYMTIHDYIHNGGVYNFSGEPLFNMLNHVVPSFFVLVAIISAVFVYIIYRLISGNLPSGYVWVGVFIFLFNPYLFLVNLSALRQCLAMCAFIIAVNAAYKKRFLLYVVLVAIGALCHKSA